MISANPSISVPLSAVERRPTLSPKLAQFALIATLCLSITAPVITLSASLPWFKVEQLALPLIAVVYAWLLFAGLARPLRWNGMFLVGAAYTLCIAISTFGGWLLLGHTVILRDFYEIPKVLFPVFFFTFGFECELSPAALRRLLNFFSFAIFLVCAYAWAQWADLGISHTLSTFYSGGLHDAGALSHYRRVYSTMGNPNLLGQLMTWSIAAFLLAALVGFGSRIRNVAMTLACLVTLLMTGSRYGLLNTSLVFALIFVLLLMDARSRKTAIVYLLILLPTLAVSALVVARSNRATAERLQSLRNPLTTDSLQDRVDDLWRDAGREIAQSPFLGHGPAKTVFSGVITDSEYLDVLKEFGLVGFFVYLGYYLYPFLSLWKGIRQAASPTPFEEPPPPGEIWAVRLSFVMVVTALVMNVGMSTFYNPALQGFLWMWLGIGAQFLAQIVARSVRSKSSLKLVGHSW